MKFLAMTLIPYAPDPVTGVQPSTNERLRAVVARIASCLLVVSSKRVFAVWR